MQERIENMDLYLSLFNLSKKMRQSGGGKNHI